MGLYSKKRVEKSNFDKFIEIGIQGGCIFLHFQVITLFEWNLTKINPN